MFRPGRTFRIVVLATLVGLLAVTSAQAAVRYAAPGGTGVDPCASPATPCTIYKAADGGAPGTTVQAGDEVVLAPGEYTDAGEELGPGSKTVQLAPGISVHGENGAPRPLIRLVEASAGFGAFIVGEGDTLSHVEIDTATARSNLSVFEGVLEDVIARNTSEMPQSTTCVQFAGTIRDSVCLAAASGSAAIGESNATVTTSTARLRNVTAVSTGTSGSGLSYAIFNSGTVVVNAKAVIAKGAGTDVVANGAEFGGGSGHVTIELDHSDYSTAKETHAAGGSASVTPLGTNGNITGEPLLAADGYHQLEGSPTIDTGAVDGFSGAADIDGQSRSIGPPDIGADEWLHPTVVTVTCAPAEVVLTDALPGSGTDCKARVSDETTNFTEPTGTVSFTSSSSGEFSAGSCTLVPSASGAESKCEVHYTPKIGSARKHTITASYSGDGTHEGSQGTTSVAVSEAPLVCAPSAGAKHQRHCRGPQKRKRVLRVRLKKKPAKKTHRHLAKFSFTANQKGARFECKLDRKPYRSCRSPYKHRVRPGHHVFSVRAVRGKVRSKPARYAWRVLRR